MGWVVNIKRYFDTLVFVGKKVMFKSKSGDIALPVFFPDATRAVLKALDSEDIKATKTPGVLVNTYHLYRDVGSRVIKKYGGVRSFMNWEGGVISDSGGFQVMSLAKSGPNKGSITDKGVTFVAEQNRKILLTPEKSIKFQFDLDPDMVVVLDEFTEPTATYEKAKETVERTLLWAKKSKDEYIRQCRTKGLDPTAPIESGLQDDIDKRRPYLLAVVQGGEFLDLREYCAKELAKIGFDGFGYGGWPIKADGSFNYDVAKVIADNTPRDYLLYGLGIGKPQEIVGCVDLGYTIFDCVLPTRDARHGRLYVYNADSIDEINIRDEKFYSYYVPTKEKHFGDTSPVSSACDCLLCSKYSRGYLAHLFRSKEMTAMRLATIHNLRFYSLLMEKLQEEAKS